MTGMDGCTYSRPLVIRSPRTDVNIRFVQPHNQQRSQDDGCRPDEPDEPTALMRELKVRGNTVCEDTITEVCTEKRGFHHVIIKTENYNFDLNTCFVFFLSVKSKITCCED